MGWSTWVKRVLFPEDEKLERERDQIAALLGFESGEERLCERMRRIAPQDDARSPLRCLLGRFGSRACEIVVGSHRILLTVRLESSLLPARMHLREVARDGYHPDEDVRLGCAARTGDVAFDAHFLVYPDTKSGSSIDPGHIPAAIRRTLLENRRASMELASDHLHLGVERAWPTEPASNASVIRSALRDAETIALALESAGRDLVSRS